MWCKRVLVVLALVTVASARRGATGRFSWKSRFAPAANRAGNDELDDLALDVAMLQLGSSTDVINIGGSPSGEAAKPEANSQDRATLKEAIGDPEAIIEKLRAEGLSAQAEELSSIQQAASSESASGVVKALERAAALADALGKLGRAQEAQAIRQMAEHVREARGIAEPSKAATEPEPKAAATEPEAATHQLQNHVTEILASDAPCRHCSWGKKCTNATHKHFTETQLTQYATSHMATDGTPIMEGCVTSIQKLANDMFDLSKKEGSLLAPLATVVGCVDGKEDLRCAGQKSNPDLAMRLAALLKKESNGGGSDVRYEGEVFPIISKRAGAHAVAELDNYHIHFVCTAYVSACNGPCIQYGSATNQVKTTGQDKYMGSPMNCVSERKIAGCQTLHSNYDGDMKSMSYTLAPWTEDCAHNAVINFA